MSSHKSQEAGFSMIELLIVAVVLGIMSGVIFVFFNTSIVSFFRIQESAILTSNQTSAIYRMGQVIRSATRITEATDSAITMYAYFSPQDSTLSQVRYNYNSATKSLEVERIRATGTAPNYTYPVANKETRQILTNVQLQTPIFSYRDALGSTGPFDATTYQDIKSVTLDIKTNGTRKVNGSEMKLQLSIRTRKTNL